MNLNVSSVRSSSLDVHLLPLDFLINCVLTSLQTSWASHLLLWMKQAALQRRSQAARHARRRLPWEGVVQSVLHILSERKTNESIHAESAACRHSFHLQDAHETQIFDKQDKKMKELNTQLPRRLEFQVAMDSVGCRNISSTQKINRHLRFLHQGKTFWKQLNLSWINLFFCFLIIALTKRVTFLQ